MAEYHPLRPSDIEWHKPYTLYRATNQGCIEQALLISLATSREPKYWGNRKNGKRITSCSTYPEFTMLGNRHQKYVSQNDAYEIPQKNYLTYPFTVHPAIIEINAQAYQDELIGNLRLSRTEVALRHPIRWDDLSFIYAAQSPELDEKGYLGLCPIAKPEMLSRLKAIQKEWQCTGWTLIDQLECIPGDTRNQLMEFIRPYSSDANCRYAIDVFIEDLKEKVTKKRPLF